MKYIHTVTAVALLHPKVIPLFTGYIDDAEAGLGIVIAMPQGLRTFAYQNGLYAIGRTVMGHNPTPAMPMGERVTNAKGGQSYHNYGLAGDTCPLKADGVTFDWDYDFSLLVPYAAKYGLTWGGYFPSPDEDHFENKFGHNWRDLLAMYNAGNFIPGTQFVNIAA